MSHASVVATSPLLFLHPRRGHVGAVEAVGLRRFAPLPLDFVELIHFFCQPQPISAGVAAGYSAQRIREALDLGILREVAEEAFAHASLWEQRRWSRAAFLTFSQRDCECLEQDAGESSLAELRREPMAREPKREPFPARRLVPCESPLQLPAVAEEVPLDFDAIVARRSVRTFADDPTPLDVFTSILFESTRSVRESERLRLTGDPVALLDPFLAWLQVYVVVQSVNGVPRGVYQYDPLANNLRFAGPNETDDEIAACVHGQPWIGGGGFCVFAAAQWERCMWFDRHAHAYLDLLIQIGEFSQELLFPVSRAGLGAWMTPAILETTAARLLRLENLTEDAVFFMKIGPPRR